MNELKSLDLAIAIGRAVPRPLPASVGAAVQSVEVVRSDDGPSTFQISFNAEREGSARDYSMLGDDLFAPFSRVVVEVIVNAIPHVLFDGVITHLQLAPGDTRQGDTITISGEDISVMFDMTDEAKSYPMMGDVEIVARVLEGWELYGIEPEVVPPPSAPVSDPEIETPFQNETDRAYLQRLAKAYGYVFHVRPGAAPFTNVAYWGPPLRLRLPQPALSIDFGPFTNVDAVDFEYDAMAPVMILGSTLEPFTDAEVPVATVESTRLPPFATQPALTANLPNGRRQFFQNQQLSGLRAEANAQAITNMSTDSVVTARGTLDAVRYGGLLEAPGVVGLRGAGDSHDGLYYVKQVSHRVTRDSYKQDFVLTREGLGTTIQEVRT